MSAPACLRACMHARVHSGRERESACVCVCVCVCVSGKMYLLVMGNIFDTDRVIHQRYDLKVK